MSILLRTIHGSHLYNTHHKNSDNDTYAVVMGGKTRQRIDGSEDVTTVNIHDYLKFVAKGVPQAVEALWSPYVWMDESWTPFFNGLRPDFEVTIETYRKTIYNFFVNGTDKARLHAMRLSYNLEQFVDTGKFNPVLSNDQVLVLRWWATDPVSTMKFINWTSPVEVFDHDMVL